MSHKIEVKAEIGLKGRFKFIRICAATGEVRQETDWMDNLVVNQGLDMIGSEVSGGIIPFEYCQVGSGNTPPVGGDVDLDTWVAGTNTLQTAAANTNLSVVPFYRSSTLTYRFGEGVAVGNLSEVGIGHAATGAVLFSRALIVDGLGVPTTITVLADEYLDVLWELRIYPPTVDITGSFNLTILGVVTSHTYTIRPAAFTNGNNWILAASGSNTIINQMKETFADGSTSGGVGPTAARLSMVSTGGLDASWANNITGTRAPMSVNGTKSVYVTSNYYLDLNFRYSLNFGNVGGITALSFNCAWMTWQMAISPSVAKDATRIFEIVMRVSWANH